MCGIACYLGPGQNESLEFGKKAVEVLKHRGPDDSGIYTNEGVTLIHRRLSIVELSELGHQPMFAANGRYVIVYNGEIYNHADLRKKYLPAHPFKGHGDTETILELFTLMQEKMLEVMVGMWALIIWDKITKKIFISRDRYGQKPLYVRRMNDAWIMASEIKPLLDAREQPAYNPTAIAEYLALGNYGHLGIHSFFENINNFPQGSYAWLAAEDRELKPAKYWELPLVPEKDKAPFDKSMEKELHDCVVEGVLSQTMSDVPIGITLSGGIDSSIIAGILATYYEGKIHIFTAQSPNTPYDETKYVDAVLEKYGNKKFIVHRKNLSALSIKDDLEKFIAIQEEPFGDPSIMAHGFLMNMAAEAGIKVILNGQGADELFYGYNNMTQAILLKQLKAFQFNKFSENLKNMNLGKSFLARTLLKSMFPGMEFKLRLKSRINRRSFLQQELLDKVNENLVCLYKYDNLYNVWKESILGIHIPHLVHYDDRNGMAYSIEGRCPFLDHRIAACVAKIKPESFLERGLRKYLLRETCKQYLPEITYKRTDKIGFYTPLPTAVKNDKEWIAAHLANERFVKNEYRQQLLQKLSADTLTPGEALITWRMLSVNLWMNRFHCKSVG